MRLKPPDPAPLPTCLSNPHYTPRPTSCSYPFPILHARSLPRSQVSTAVKLWLWPADWRPPGPAVAVAGTVAGGGGSRSSSGMRHGSSSSSGRRPGQFPALRLPQPAVPAPIPPDLAARELQLLQPHPPLLQPHPPQRQLAREHQQHPQQQPQQQQEQQPQQPRRRCLTYPVSSGTHQAAAQAGPLLPTPPVSSPRAAPHLCSSGTTLRPASSPPHPPQHRETAALCASGAPDHCTQHAGSSSSTGAAASVPLPPPPSPPPPPLPPPAPVWIDTLSWPGLGVLFFWQLGE